METLRENLKIHVKGTMPQNLQKSIDSEIEVKLNRKKILLFEDKSFSFIFIEILYNEVYETEFFMKFTEIQVPIK